MRALPRAAALCLATLLLSPLAAAARVAAVRDFPAAIEGAVKAGELDRATADLYWLYAVRAPERLPERYRTAVLSGDRAARVAAGGAAPLELSCGTPVLRAVRSRLESMPAELREEAGRLLAGPAVAAPARRGAAKTVAHELPNWIETENFSFEWGPEIIAANGQAAVDADGNGLPDVVEQWAAYFEASFAFARQLGFVHPILEDRLVSVYIGNSDPNTDIDDIGAGVLGFTSGFPRELPYIVVQSDLRTEYVNDEGEASGGTAWDAVEANVRGNMKIVAAHEFFHVFHFLLEPPAWVTAEDDWWQEATSTWFEDEVFDGVNQYHSRFEVTFEGDEGWAETVELGLPVTRSLDDPTVNYTVRAYGAVIFAKFLAEHVGGQESQREFWDLTQPSVAAPEGRRALEALDAYAQVRGYESLEELFLGFAAANAVMDYEEGAHFGFAAGETVPVRKLSLAADSAVDTIPGSTPPAPLPVPAYLGATYLREAGLSGGRRISVAGTSALGASPWGLSLMVRRPEGHSVALGALDAGGAPAVEVAGLAPEDEVFAAVSFLTPGATGTGYATTAAAAAPVPVALGAPALTSVSVPGRGAGLGGVRLAWAPLGGAAGYVARWRLLPSGAFESRTVFGSPMDPDSGDVTLELRSLRAGASYEVRVFAYDAAGAEGLEAVAAPVVAGPAPSTTLPAVRILAEQVTDGGINVPERGSGSKGIGGIDCFLRVLGRW